MRLAIFLLILASTRVNGLGDPRKQCHVFNTRDYGVHSSERCGTGRCWSAVTLGGWYLGGCKSISQSCSAEFFEKQGAAKGGINKESTKCCDESWCNGIDEKWRMEKDWDKNLGERTPKPPGSPFDDNSASSVRTFCVAGYLLMIAVCCAIVF